MLRAQPVPGDTGLDRGEAIRDAPVPAIDYESYNSSLFNCGTSLLSFTLFHIQSKNINNAVFV